MVGDARFHERIQIVLIDFEVLSPDGGEQIEYSTLEHRRPQLDWHFRVLVAIPGASGKLE